MDFCGTVFAGKTEHSFGLACRMEEVFGSSPRGESFVGVSLSSALGLVGSTIAWALAEARLWRMLLGLSQKSAMAGLHRAFGVAFSHFDR